MFSNSSSALIRARLGIATAIPSSYSEWLRQTFNNCAHGLNASCNTIVARKDNLFSSSKEYVINSELNLVPQKHNHVNCTFSLNT